MSGSVGGDGGLLHAIIFILAMIVIAGLLIGGGYWWGVSATCR